MYEKKPIKPRYIQCQKGTFHEGEFLNIVCMEPGCFDNPICCCACASEEHSKHKTIPLKNLMASLQDSGNSKLGLNADIVMGMMNDAYNKIQQKMRKSRQMIINALDTMEAEVREWYKSTKQSLQGKNRKVQTLLEQLQVVSTPMELKDSVKLLISLNQSSHTAKTEKQLIQTITNKNNEISSVMEEVATLVGLKQSYVGEILLGGSVWDEGANHFFSSTYKHSNVKLLSEYEAIAQSANGYKFALLDNTLEDGSRIKVNKYKIVECSGNWIAVGMCHREVVRGYQYGFNYSHTGHGAYMVSSNGGSWSNINQEQNNKVRAFNFNKGSVIQVTVDFETKRINFKSGVRQYELPFQLKVGDRLYPCVVFYYTNDKVQIVKI